MEQAPVTVVIIFDVVVVVTSTCGSGPFVLSCGLMHCIKVYILGALEKLKFTQKFYDSARIPAQTLKWLKVPKDSSDFDDSWTELIVTT